MTKGGVQREAPGGGGGEEKNTFARRPMEKESSMITRSIGVYYSMGGGKGTTFVCGFTGKRSSICPQFLHGYRPSATGGVMPKNIDRLTRRQLAGMLNLHPDSATRMLHEGLAAAVVEWGGRGKEMIFSRRLAMRFVNARDCRRDGGRRCRKCRYAMEDIMAVAEHLLEERHGSGGCDECTEPPTPCMPCST